MFGMNTARDSDNDDEMENVTTEPIDVDSDGEIENFPTEADRTVASYGLTLRDNRGHLMYCTLIDHHASIDFSFQVEQIAQWVQTLPDKIAEKLALDSVHERPCWMDGTCRRRWSTLVCVPLLSMRGIQEVRVVHEQQAGVANRDLQLYHGTTPARALEIIETGYLKCPESSKGIWGTRQLGKALEIYSSERLQLENLSVKVAFGIYTCSKNHARQLRPKKTQFFSRSEFAVHVGFIVFCEPELFVSNREPEMVD